MRVPALAINLTIAATATLVTIGVVELVLRVYDPYAHLGHFDRSEEHVGVTEFHGAKLQGDANSLGLRDTEYDLTHTTYRILALGDSFTYGFRLHYANSWPKQLERQLRNDGYRNLEVLNGGRPNTDTKWQYDFFKDYAAAYTPDMVIIGFIINDCTQLCSNCGAVKLKAALEAAAVNESVPFRSYLLRYARLCYLKYRLTRETVKEYTQPYDEKRHGFQECTQAFLEFKHASVERHFKLIVVIYPMLFDLHPGYPLAGIHEKMLAFFLTSGIVAYDLTPAFFGYRDTDLWVAYNDSHPNAIANEIAAKRIAAIVEPELK